MQYIQERDSVLKAAKRMSKDGLVMGTWGNISARCKGEEKIVITPSGMFYENLLPEDLAVVDFEGNLQVGKYKPSIETPMHLEIYKHRPDVGGIVHAHSIYASAFAVARTNIPVILEETAQVVGHEIQVTDYQECGSSNLANQVLDKLGTDGAAVLLANHGLVCVAQSAGRALAVVHVVEKTAMVALLAKQIGQPHSISPVDIISLHDRAKSYGQRK